MNSSCPACGGFAYEGFLKIECFNRLCRLSPRMAKLSQHDQELVRNMATAVDRLREEHENDILVDHSVQIKRLEKQLDKLLGEDPIWEINIED
jgi:uncharacterized protein Yka (UPF0111/DUF47 family)